VSRPRTSVRRFEGEISGLGTRSGVRVIVGDWHSSPYGTFCDVMVQQPDGHRVLLAPDHAVADFVAGTYRFDEVVLGPVRLARSMSRRELTAPGLTLGWSVGRPTLLGVALALVPRRLAVAPAWLRLINPVARVLLRGVSTAGSAGGGRREFYGAYGVRRLTDAAGSWRGTLLGPLAPVDPPVTFGFGSTPRTPMVTRLVTTIRETAGLSTTA